LPIMKRTIARLLSTDRGGASQGAGSIENEEQTNV
jgi:hypothetical protein